MREWECASRVADTSRCLTRGFSEDVTLKKCTTTAVTPLLLSLRMGGCLSKRKREQRGEENILEALAVQMPDVFYSEILPKLDMTDTLNLAQVSKSCNDAVWSVDGVRSMEAKIEAKIKAASTSSCYSKLLYWTARHGNVSAVRAILKSWVYVNVGDFDWTPLHFATHYGHTPVVKALIEAGADVDKKTYKSVSKNYCGYTSLHLAASRGHALVITELIKAGADVNATEDEGLAPLHKAAFEGHASVITELIKAGADVNAIDGHRWAPLHQAATKGHAPVITELIKAGADVNATEDEGWAPLHRAAWFGHEDCVAVLLAHGADVHKARKQWIMRITPMKIAVHFRRKKIIEMLKQAGG